MKILITGDLLEQFQYVERLPEVVKEAHVDAVLFTGNILRAQAREAEWRRALAERRAPRLDLPGVQKQRNDYARSLHRFFAALGSLGVPACFVPGRNDAPERLVVQAAFNAEVVAANVHAVHRSFAPLGGNWIVAGFGGEITAEERDHQFFLRYPGWEAQFALDFLRHLDQDKILLFHTPPVERFEDQVEPTGHETVSHIIETFAPHFAVCGRAGGRQSKLTLATTPVVCPGRLSEGKYTILDTRERKVSFGNVR
jgi:uncharacterized protein